MGRPIIFVAYFYCQFNETLMQVFKIIRWDESVSGKCVLSNTLNQNLFTPGFGNFFGDIWYHSLNKYFLSPKLFLKEGRKPMT